MRAIYILIGLLIFSGCQGNPFGKVSSLTETQDQLTEPHIQEHDHWRIRIQSITTKNGRTVLRISNEEFEVSPFSQMSDAWVEGQRVKLVKNPVFSYYDVLIENIDNGEQVKAKKIS